MNVYDFDGTIYKGDSSFDFFRFELSRNGRLLKYVPCFVSGYIKYLNREISKEEFKECIFIYLKDIDDIDKEICEFWKAHRKKIYKWYLDKKQSNDIIVSAGPEFLLKPICNELKINLIASIVDSKTGKLKGLNNNGKEKLRRLKEECGVEHINCFYSDSLSDSPVTEIAEHSYFIKNGRITDWPVKR